MDVSRNHLNMSYYMKKKQKARKSTQSARLMLSVEESEYVEKPTTTKALNDDLVYIEKPSVDFHHIFWGLKAELKPKEDIQFPNPHEHSPKCIENVEKLDAEKIPPLLQPILYGWKRFFKKDRSAKSAAGGRINYLTPCKAVLTNIRAVHRYLTATESVLKIDSFDFDDIILENRMCTIKEASKCQYFCKDLSMGLEKFQIKVINQYGSEPPKSMIYTTNRSPQGFTINTDPEFMACCDCTDDCSDKNKCACQQMTINSYKFMVQNTEKANDLEDIGYEYKRLSRPVGSGIYECHSRCKCKENCHNRVAQEKMRCRVMLVRTVNKGWGVFATHDIPEGSFICNYMGRVYKSNDSAQLDAAGDEYLADIDLIECVSMTKSGFELGVTYPDESFMSDNLEEDQAREFRKLQNDDDSIDPDPYIIDAKIEGNIGRYFNHSCNPNLFVQSVFCDTHDLRFPWVALFAWKRIFAGEELSWDYGYEAGTIPGKSLICHCGEDNCRGKIL